MSRVIRFRHAATAVLFLFLSLGVSADTVQLLGDPGFEESETTGSFPTSGDWQEAWLGEAGAACTQTAAHNGIAGLWQYTGNNFGDWWSGPYQEFDASAGQTYEASGYVRTPHPGPGVSWVSGASARIRLEFRNTSSGVIQEFESPGVTQSEQDWRLESTGQHIATTGTTKVRFVCYLTKPSTTGIAVANFDDCSLLRTEAGPILMVTPPVLGFGDSRTSLSFIISNSGGDTLNWSLSGQDSWLTVSDLSGSVTTTPKAVTVQVNRSHLPEFSSVCLLTVTSNGGAETVKIMAEKAPVGSVPAQPASVRISGYQIRVAKRNRLGQLLAEKPYTICGSCWSPASIGTLEDRSSRQAEFAKWAGLDIQLMYEMNCNTLYTFLDFGTGPTATKILDYLYANNIMAIVTVDWDGTCDTDRVATVVNAYKNHPAILLWAIGNEWNINYYHGKYGNPDGPDYLQYLNAAAQATQDLAILVKSLDSQHPVISILGEIDSPGIAQPLSKTDDIVNNVCTAVDLWGVNIYRGGSFSSLFTQWQSISTKPMVITEFGTDSYRTTSPDHKYPIVGYADEEMQRDFVAALLQDLRPEISAVNRLKVCAGATFFEWADEWWKVKGIDGGLPNVQDNGGFFTGWNWNAHPDGCGNEEYFGAFRIDRTQKPVYSPLRDFFTEFYRGPSAVVTWSLYE